MALILKKIPMREQDPQVRRSNFNEVALGYSLEEAMNEAQRCLNCKRPLCVEGCPVNVNIPQFIQAIVQGDIQQAYSIICRTNNLPAICGRVCPQETQCEQKCVLGRRGEPVAIGRLERFAADYCIERGIEEDVNIQPNGRKIAVVGSGPAGLTAAADRS